MDRVVRGIKQTIYKSPVWRMGHNIGQSGRKNGGCEGGKSVRETASDCRSVRLVAARCFAALDAGQDRCVHPGVPHDAHATAWHGWFQRLRAAPRTHSPSQSLARRGLYGCVRLFRQPPYFITHAFPEVDAPCGSLMALHIVPPSHRDNRIGPHDRRHILVQNRDALVNQRFELGGI
jgi:hypothetical protein